MSTNDQQFSNNHPGQGGYPGQRGYSEPGASPGQGGYPGQPAPTPEPPRRRSWFARHKVLTGILGVAVVGMAIAASQGGDGTAETAAPRADAVATDAGSPDGSQETTSGEPAPAAEALPGMGDTVVVGDFTVVVHEVATGIASVGNEFLGEEARGQFVTVSVSVTNNANEEQTFWADEQKLIDEQGREHSSSDGWIYLEDNLLVEGINPGVTVDGTLLFDIPVDATPVTLVLNSAVFGGESAEVALQ